MKGIVLRNCMSLKCVVRHQLFGVMLLFLLFAIGTAKAQNQDLNILEDGSSFNFSFQSLNLTNSGEVFGNTSVLAPLASVIVHINDIPPDVKFVILQAHAYLYNITVSYNKVLTDHTYTNGTNVGLVQLLSPNQKSAQFVILNDNADFNVTVLFAAQGYGREAPVPGGCNMEFSVEIAPFLSVVTDGLVTVVECQPAAVPLGTPASSSRSCEMRHVDLEMYHLFMPEQDFSMETYFDTIRMMMTVDDIRRNGIKVDPSTEGSALRRVYSAYPGTGSIYSVVAVSGFSGSAYVSGVSYGCNLVYGTDKCQALTTTFSKVLYAIILFLGVFICFFGHRFFKSEMFLFGFLAGGLTSYILLTVNGTFEAQETQWLSVIGGVTFGLFWLLFWIFCGFPAFSVFLPTLLLGFLVAAVIMFAGIADWPVFDSDLNYWLIFASITLSVPILFCSEVHKANMFCCGILGAFAVILPVDHYIGSNLKYILLNAVRRATDPAFRTAEIDPPFQTRDVILVSVWLGLAALGITYQWCQQSGRPPFPSPHRYETRTTRVPTPRARLRRRDDSDRDPLLADARRQYGSVATNHNEYPYNPNYMPDTQYNAPTAASTSGQRPFAVLPKFPVDDSMGQGNWTKRELFS